MRFCLILLSILTLISCGNAPRKNFFTGLDLDADVMTQLETISESINNTANHNILSFSRGNRPIKIVMVDPSQMGRGAGLSAIHGLEWHKATTLAQTRYLEYNCYVEVRSDIRDQMSRYYIIDNSDPDNPVIDVPLVDKAIQLVILHEIGHCFGLGHTPAADTDSLMNPLYQSNWATTKYNNIITTFSKILRGLSE